MNAINTPDKSRPCVFDERPCAKCGNTRRPFFRSGEGWICIDCYFEKLKEYEKRCEGIKFTVREKS